MTASLMSGTGRSHPAPTGPGAKAAERRTTVPGCFGYLGDPVGILACGQGDGGRSVLSL